MYNNLLTGKIPDEIGSPVLLRTYAANFVPYECKTWFANYSLFSTLESIYLDGNQLSGTLPKSLGYLRHLGKLKRSF